jgi:crossover junction endodeoxyribonuclease RuvC
VRILGVDPGSLATGWGVLAGSPSKPELVRCGVIRLRGDVPFAERLANLHLCLREVLERHEPDAAAVEAPFHGVSARASLQLAHARGVVLATVSLAGIPVSEYAPAMVKKTVAGNGRAPKDQVGALVRALLGPAGGGEGHDASDALSVALCHMALRLHASLLARSR